MTAVEPVTYVSTFDSMSNSNKRRFSCASEVCDADNNSVSIKPHEAYPCDEVVKYARILLSMKYDTMQIPSSSFGPDESMNRDVFSSGDLSSNVGAVKCVRPLRATGAVVSSFFSKKNNSSLNDSFSPSKSCCPYLNFKCFRRLQCALNQLKHNDSVKDTMHVYSLSEDSMQFSEVKKTCRGLGMLRMVIGGLYTVETVDRRMVEIESFNYKGGDMEPRYVYLVFNPPTMTYHLALPVKCSSGTAVEFDLSPEFKRASPSGYFLWYVEVYCTSDVIENKLRIKKKSKSDVAILKKCMQMRDVLQDTKFQHDSMHAGTRVKWVGIESVVGVIYMRSLPIVNPESLAACSARHKSTGLFPNAIYRAFDVCD